MEIKLILESGTCSKSNKWTKIYLINKEQLTLTHEGILTKVTSNNGGIEIIGSEKEEFISAINKYESTVKE
jgi:hypothetical protein